MLTACGPSLEVGPVKELAEPGAAPPQELLQPCAGPVELPAGPLNAGPALRYWATDRENLAECGLRLDAVVGFYERRDAALASKKKPPTLP